MSTVAGIDLSSRAIDIVKLDEDTDQAEWFRFELEGASAWERTRQVRERLPGSSWWDDVYLAAIETPFPDQQGVLRRVQGAVMACIPNRVVAWEANQAAWKRGLELKAKPTAEDVERLMPGIEFEGMRSVLWAVGMQDTWDAACIALWARETNRRGIERITEARASGVDRCLLCGWQGSPDAPHSCRASQPKAESASSEVSG